jgi:hypothetical protein
MLDIPVMQTNHRSRERNGPIQLSDCTPSHNQDVDSNATSVIVVVIIAASSKGDGRSICRKTDRVQV